MLAHYNSFCVSCTVHICVRVCLIRSYANGLEYFKFIWLRSQQKRAFLLHWCVLYFVFTTQTLCGNFFHITGREKKVLLYNSYNSCAYLPQQIQQKMKWMSNGFRNAMLIYTHACSSWIDRREKKDAVKKEGMHEDSENTLSLCALKRACACEIEDHKPVYECLS